MSFDARTVKSILVGLAFLTPEQQDALSSMSVKQLSELCHQLLTATYRWAEEGEQTGDPTGPGGLVVPGALGRPASRGQASSWGLDSASTVDTGRELVGFGRGSPGSSQPTGIAVSGLAHDALFPGGRPGAPGMAFGTDGQWPGALTGLRFPSPERPLAIEPPMLSVDEQGEYAVHPTVALIEAFEEDLVASKSYLQEGEGDLLAKHLGVQAEIFDQQEPTIPIIQRNLSLGSGNTSGALLFVNRNHYVVLIEMDKADPSTAAVMTKEGRRFRFGAKTVADGDCLIDVC